MTNITTIQFDSVLLEEIKKFKEKYVTPYKLKLHSHELDVMESIQNNIRVDIEKYLLPNINFADHKNKVSKPNMYSLFILMLLDNPNQFNDWTDLSYVFYNHYNNGLNDDIVNHKYDLNLSFVDYTYDPIQYTCACGKNGCSSNKMGKIGNDKIAFLFGSVCIDKTGIEYSKLCNKRNYQKEKEKELEKEKEKALNHLIPFGKYKGKMTYKKLGEENPNYLIYMKNKLNFFDNDNFKNNVYYREFIDGLI